jgi:hypothetical protein
MKVLRILVMMILMMRISSLNICVESIEESKLVTRSFLSPVKVARNYTCCPNLSCNPPVCTEYMVVMKRKWRVENLTITKNLTECCPGYTITSGGVNISSISDQPVQVYAALSVSVGVAMAHVQVLLPVSATLGTGERGVDRSASAGGRVGVLALQRSVRRIIMLGIILKIILLRRCWKIFILRDNLSVMSC